MLLFCALLVAAVTIGLAAVGRTERQSAPEAAKLQAAIPAAVKPVHPSNVPGLHNVYRLGETLYSGSSPDDDEAFDSLSRLGVKTIVSVDGAPPELDAARAHGMRYVHLPITYGSVPHETLVGLVRATHELPGPVYVHCHHGKHRGPAAAVSLWRCLDKHVTDEQAVATMKRIGTADRYQGLFDSVRGFTRPTDAELTFAKSDLPESTHVPPLAASMSAIDRMWDRVAKPVGDRTTTTLSMQLNTAYDLAEQFREAARLGDVADGMQPEFQAIVADLERLAEIIQAELKSPSAPSPHRADAAARIANRCTACHTQFRD
jgi:protein tyrosine phosphatase (PTP) superfamily phosphohydrolase (DUF442 family)